MRQKFQLVRDKKTNVLKIKEYAVIDKNLKNVATAHLREMDFFLISEEIYEAALIEDAISRKEHLKQTLRTENFFPIEGYAEKIAEAVVGLYDSKKASRVELFFDDMRPIS